MKINNISPINYLPKQQFITAPKAQNPIKMEEPKKLFAYQDYNISFQARTPENFYEQDFNVKNMPKTMKEYLYFDYENRKHIPPEQMMQEVFKYIDLADNFDEVKKMYPTETLFEDLHSNTKKSRNTLLAEIDLVKAMSDEPLFKDGSDDMGMYLLKKIYIEGKTVKEINKDFYEKDVNDAYKGLLKREISYDTTDAYGIKYPKRAFWKSFIATREEYKKFFVTLPKKEPLSKEVLLNGYEKAIRTSEQQKKDIQPKKAVRKYKTPTHKKTQLTNEIKNSKGDLETIEKKIRKRFSNSDIEAPFVLKYLSPIMTIAADRVHLSEEMKIYADKSKTELSNGERFFSRFWKENPLILEDYSKTIPDTIELFEETYEEGGLIPINKNFEVINQDSNDKKVIDYVSIRFLELLNYAKSIDAERQTNLVLHNKNQEELNEVFSHLKLDEPAKVEQPIKNVVEISEEKITEMVKKSAQQYKADFFELKDKDGNKIVLTGSLDEAFHDCLIELLGTVKYYPTSFQEKYKKHFLARPEVDEKYKLSVVAASHDIQSDELYSSEELMEITDKMNFPSDFFLMPLIASFAIADYLTIAYSEDIANVLQGTTATREFYDLLSEYVIEEDEEKFLLSNIVLSDKKNLDTFLKYYCSQPLSRKEQLTIKTALLNQLPHFLDGAHGTSDIRILADIINDNKTKDSSVKQQLGFLIEDWLKKTDVTLSRYLARSILNQEYSKENLEDKRNFLLKMFFEQTLFSEKVGKLMNLITEEGVIENFKYFTSDMQEFLTRNMSITKKFLRPI